MTSLALVNSKAKTDSVDLTWVSSCAGMEECLDHSLVEIHLEMTTLDLLRGNSQIHQLQKMAEMFA